jgi:hypothetical protein
MESPWCWKINPTLNWCIWQNQSQFCYFFFQLDHSKFFCQFFLSLNFFFFNLILLYYDNARLTLVIYFNWFGMRSSRYIEKQIWSRLMLDLTKLNLILLIFFTDSFHVIFLSFDCFGHLNFVFQFNPFTSDWYKVGRGNLFWLALYAVLAVLGKQIRCSVNVWFGKIKFILFDFFYWILLLLI